MAIMDQAGGLIEDGISTDHHIVGPGHRIQPQEWSIPVISIDLQYGSITTRGASRPISGSRSISLSVASRGASAPPRFHRRGPRSYRRRRHSTGDHDRILGRLHLRLRPRDHHLLLVDVKGHRTSSNQVLPRMVRDDPLWQNDVFHLIISQIQRHWNVYHQVPFVHLLRQSGGLLPLSCLGEIQEPQPHPRHHQE